MNRFLVLLMSLVLAMPVQALDLQGLYEQALTASRQGDFVEALPLWDRFLEQAPEDAAALSNRGNVRLALGDPSGACLLYTSPSPRDMRRSRMPSSA